MGYHRGLGREVSVKAGGVPNEEGAEYHREKGLECRIERGSVPNMVRVPSAEC